MTLKVIIIVAAVILAFGLMWLMGGWGRGPGDPWP